MEEREIFGKAVGKYVRLRRFSKKLTLEDLAEITDLDDKNLGKIERGEKIPTTFTLYKLHKGLDMSVDSLFEQVTEELKALNKNNK
ncbi:helix-turn-helix transcriptional regulator [Cytobacillus sp. IB215665]|uniref:helix-turn-helix domain-containing protein n=1 Tax=Cytobacillus sp. IB215665 TaxID=3097357 RepID=UPI002A0C168D|nr:helix-turn-helix transcriptional regulator [Cytobacillus sp. IB215665]MDX8363777.1 helix-turn-helix transcriptional regulator [Cytobacillus sp. IB215665]